MFLYGIISLCACKGKSGMYKIKRIATNRTQHNARGYINGRTIKPGPEPENGGKSVFDVHTTTHHHTQASSDYCSGGFFYFL